MFPTNVDLARLSCTYVFTSAGLILLLSILASFWSGICPQLSIPGTISATEGLQDDFYLLSCPLVEPLINQRVLSSLSQNRSLAAGLLRMAFHDCFVQGCDASVLLSSDWNGNPSERDAPPNKNSLRGFELIQDIKTSLESLCPNTVSCADIVVLAARDAVVQTGGPYYSLPKGRRDSRNSSAERAKDELPSPTFNISSMIKSFRKRGLNETDLVSLLGSHTIGVASCSTFNNRFTELSASGLPDARLNTSLFLNLTEACQNATDSSSSHIPLDADSSADIFDNSYYKNLVLGKGVLATDQALMDDPSTSALVKAYAQNQQQFFEDFKQGMIRLSKLGVLSRDEGEVRNDCSIQN